MVWNAPEPELIESAYSSNGSFSVMLGLALENRISYSRT
jgi:hypothetical protein